MRDYATELAELAAKHFDNEENVNFVEEFSNEIRNRVREYFVARQRSMDLGDG